MFDQLVDSAEAGTKKKKSLFLTISVVFHAVLIVVAIILPLVFPETLSGAKDQLTFLVAPPPPPPPPSSTSRCSGSGQESHQSSGNQRLSGSSGNSQGCPHGGG